MIRRITDRRGVTTGDVLIGVAVLSLVLALAYPTLRARSFNAGLVDTVTDVEVLRSSAEAYLSDNRIWPASAQPGAIPGELRGSFPGRSNLIGEAYTLQWARFDVVEYVEVPAEASPEPIPGDASPEPIPPTYAPVARQIGGIVLRTPDEALLGELLERYGTTDSFVRDSTWTLVLPTRAGS